MLFRSELESSTPIDSYMVPNDIVNKLSWNEKQKEQKILSVKPGGECEKLMNEGPFWETWTGLAAHKIKTYRACMNENSELS